MKKEYTERTGPFTWILFLAIFACFTWINSGTAFSQSLADNFSGFSADSDQPINIESDELEVKDSEKIAIFTGNVEVQQGDLKLRTIKLFVHYSGEGRQTTQQQIERIEAKGKVIVTSEDNKMTGDWAIFEMDKDLITVGGKQVVVTQGKNVLTGTKLVVDLTTNTSKMESNQRVKGLFIPKSRQN